MKRTTIVLDDELAVRLAREQRRHGASASAVVREALTAYFSVDRQSRQPSFAKLGRTGTGEAVGRNAEAILAEEYADSIARRNGLSSRDVQQRSSELAVAGRSRDEETA